MDYVKVRRIPMGGKIARKRYLTEDETAELLSGQVVIEEKLDGKTEASECDDRIVFGEFLKWRHSIRYDRLPAWFIAFDVYDPTSGLFLDYDSKTAFLARNGFAMTPLIFRGQVTSQQGLVRFLGASKFASDGYAEGIVIKNYPKQLFGKLVRTEFIEGITTHWLRRRREMNRLLITNAAYRGLSD